MIKYSSPTLPDERHIPLDVGPRTSGAPQRLRSWSSSAVRMSQLVVKRMRSGWLSRGRKPRLVSRPRDQEVIDCYGSSVLEGERGYPDGGTRQIMRNKLPQRRMVRVSQLYS